MSAVLHIDERDLCLVCVRAEGLNVEDGEAIPIEQVAQVDPAIVRDRVARRKYQRGPAILKESEMSKAVCDCGCSGELSDKDKARGRTFIWGHHAAKGGSGAPRKARSKTKRREGTPDGLPIAGPCKYTIAVSEQFLENAWAKLTPEFKAIAIAAALEA